MISASAGVAKSGLRRGAQDPVAKAFVGSNPTSRTNIWMRLRKKSATTRVTTDSRLEIPMGKKLFVRVLASGVFDLVHYGHIHFLKQAKKAGGDKACLIVVVARDKTVARLKGKPPVLPEEQRREIVESLKPVDEAILGAEDFDMAETLNLVKPDIVAVGFDQIHQEAAVKKVIAEKGLGVKVIRIGRFVASGLESSSGIKRKIASGE